MAWQCGACGAENPDGTRFCGQCGERAGAGGGDTDAALADALTSFVSAQVAEKIAATGELREERRLVTCLFADLSGFTPLADRLDPEELVEVIDPIIERLTNIVGRYEGYVDKFAGDALLAFFGAPVAHEDDAQRALKVALEMHRELAELVPELPPEAAGLTLHIGVNTGHVVARVLGTDVRMDYALLGDAVILAQRLEAATPAGATYVGLATHELTRGDFVFAPVGELELKGKAEPVMAWRLIGEGKHRRAGEPLFVGRDEEYARVRSLIDALGDGEGALVSVAGDPGVGKSRLTEEARDYARLRGLRWMTARCVSYGSGIAYWPYSELFRRLAAITPRDPDDVALPRLTEGLDAAGFGDSRPFFARLVGLPAPEIEHYDPESFRRELHAAMARGLAWIASNGPTVLALEDLQWADASSISLTAELV
ncbi:MAG: AAA family ATPase, partial [Actinomycetota bacterium]|nr:AAA family ATPase [Actinomycetota bacterium]